MVVAPVVYFGAYGRDLPFLRGLDEEGQLYVAEIPTNFRCWPRLPQYRSLRREFSTKQVRNVTRWSPAFIYQQWKPVTIRRDTVEPAVWDVKAAQVYLRNARGRPTDRTYWLIVAWIHQSNDHRREHIGRRLRERGLAVNPALRASVGRDRRAIGAVQLWTWIWAGVLTSPAQAGLAARG